MSGTAHVSDMSPPISQAMCPVDFCDDFDQTCQASGVEAGECGIDLCLKDPCTACNEAMTECNESGASHCELLGDKCREELSGCCTGLVTAACPSTDILIDGPYIREYCRKHPLAPSVECGGDAKDGPLRCADAIESFAGCDVTLCEYEACAAAMSSAPCGVTPPECIGISSCDGAPVHLPPPVLSGCAPAVDMCESLKSLCEKVGLHSQECYTISNFICPGSERLACEKTKEACANAGLSCGEINDLCDENLAGCDNTERCRESGLLTSDQTVSLCFAFPWILDGCGSSQEEGLCIWAMSTAECEIDSCEWRRCMEDAALFGDACPAIIPETCTDVMACVQDVYP